MHDATDLRRSPAHTLTTHPVGPLDPAPSPAPILRVVETGQSRCRHTLPLRCTSLLLHTHSGPLTATAVPMKPRLTLWSLAPQPGHNQPPRLRTSLPRPRFHPAPA